MNYSLILQNILRLILFFSNFFVPLQPQFKGCPRVWAEMIPSNLIRTMPA